MLDNPPLESEKQFGAQIRGFTPGDKIRCQVYSQATDSRREVVIEVGAVGVDPEIVRKLRIAAGLSDVEIWKRPENWELLPNCFLQVSQQQQVLKLMREVKEAKAESDKMRQEKEFAEESEKLAREYAENTKDFVDNLKKKRQEEYEREKEAARKRAEAYLKLVKGDDGTVRREGDVSAIDRLDVPDGIIDYPTARKPLTDFKGWLQKCAKPFTRRLLRSAALERIPRCTLCGTAVRIIVGRATVACRLAHTASYGSIRFHTFASAYYITNQSDYRESGKTALTKSWESVR